jgi:chromosome segregation ATPase
MAQCPFDAVEVPFRALDEFDVFMDALNRKVSINLLVQVKKTKQSYNDKQTGS